MGIKERDRKEKSGETAYLVDSNGRGETRVGESTTQPIRREKEAIGRHPNHTRDNPIFKYSSLFF